MTRTGFAASLAAVLLAVVAAPPAGAQAPATTPGPEHERLAYFVGEWTMEGEAKDGPLGPGGPLRTTESCSWFPGGFHVVCRSRGTTPRGEGESQAVMSYDASRQTYTYHGITSFGDVFFVNGRREGSAWIWEDEMTIEGKRFAFRVTVTEQPPDRYEFLMESSFDGGPWQATETGTATRKR